MTAVRDPAFWRRFSMAVHLDEEKGGSVSSASSAASTTTKERPKLDHTDSWLDRHRKKRQRAICCGWTITLIIILLMAGIAMACLWLFKVGPFSHRQ